MVTPLATLIGFVVSLVVSTIIIYIVTRFLGDKEGVGTAVIAAVTGSVIYALSYFFLGGGLLATLAGGIFWLLALGTLYNMGWTKALLTAIVVWIFASVTSIVLPTLTGPL